MFKFKVKYVKTHGTKELLTYHPYFSRLGTKVTLAAFCRGFFRLEVPEQALDGILLGLGSVMKINLLNLHIDTSA